MLKNFPISIPKKNSHYFKNCCKAIKQNKKILWNKICWIIFSFETSEGLHWYFSRKWMFPRGKKRETRNFRKQFTTYLRTWFIRVPTLRHFPYYILLICISPFEWTKLPIAYYVILFFCNMTYIIKKHISCSKFQIWNFFHLDFRSTTKYNLCTLYNS